MEKEPRSQITVACGAICEQQGKILMVKEYRLDEGFVLNQPVGKLDLHEDVFEGTRREIKEETGLEIELTHLLGVYVWILNNRTTSIRFCFVARVVGGTLRPEPREDNETVEPVWLSREELRELEGMFRNPITKKCLEDYFCGKRFPLEAIETLWDR
jgi:ADP-ribose pyrophosphatase YjhB (NUDIX family)